MVLSLIDNAINPCLESSYTFVDHVIKAVTEMHRDIQPLKVFHFGGDEVASKAWTGSPVCVAKKPLDNSTNVAEWMEELKEEFVQVMDHYYLSYVFSYHLLFLRNISSSHIYITQKEDIRAKYIRN